MSQEITIRHTTGEIIDVHEPARLTMLDTYANGGVADEEPRIDAIATISGGYREKGADGHAGRPVVSRDGTIYLHDPRGRAPNLKAALAARGNKSLTIAFPFNNPAAFVQQRFLEYSSTHLLAHGDEMGITTIDPKTGRHDYHEAGSPGFNEALKRCKVGISIYFTLAEWTAENEPKVVLPDGLGLYRLRSTSRNTLRNLRAAIDHVSSFTHGRLAGVPFDIALDYRDVAGPDGSRRNVPCWTFVMRPPVPITRAAHLATTLTRAVQEGRLLQLPPPSAETMEVAVLEGPLADDSDDIAMPSDEDARMIAAGGRCDPRHYEALWFATVQGSFLDSEEMRARFIEDVTAGKNFSLAGFLSAATNADADVLIASAAAAIAKRAEQDARSEAKNAITATGKTARELARPAAAEEDDDERPQLLKLYGDRLREAQRLGIDLTAYALSGSESAAEIKALGLRLRGAIQDMSKQAQPLPID